MHLYLFILALAGQILSHFAIRAWKNRAFPGFLQFFLAQAALVLWILFYLGEQLDPANRTLWFLGKFTWIGLVAPSMFLFVLRYTGLWRKAFGPWLMVYFWAVCLPPIAMTNDWHHGFFREIVLRNELVGLNGPLFLFHAGYNYLLILGSIVLLMGNAVTDPHRRGPSLSLALAFSIPLVASMVNELTKTVAQGSPFLAVNPTLPSFVVSTMAFGWAVFRQRLLDPRPIARDRVFQLLPEGLVVLDQAGIVVDFNEYARHLLSGGRNGPLGQRLDEAPTPLQPFAKAHLLGSELDVPWVLTLNEAGMVRTFQVTASRLKSHQQSKGGWLLTIRDTGRPNVLRRMEEKGLTAREQELVEWVNQGLSNKEIALLLDISTATVKNHLYNVFRKCGVGSRRGLIRVLKGEEVGGIDGDGSGNRA